ncbi:MAG TPA: hypothetical protein VIU11_11935 [Nakamurella sp.]
MSDSANFEERLTAAEARIEEVAADAAAARHLAAAGDRDLADLTMRVIDNQRSTEANRTAINALSVQTAERFQHVETRFQHLEDKVDAGFVEIRAKLDQTTAGLAVIIELLSSGDNEN